MLLTACYASDWIGREPVTGASKAGTVRFSSETVPHKWATDDIPPGIPFYPTVRRFPPVLGELTPATLDRQHEVLGTIDGWACPNRSES